MSIRRTLIAAVVFAAFAISGCEAQYQDVSGEDEYRNVIGTRCELLVSLRAHGVGNKYGPERSTDYISVWNPGFTGPEVTFVESLSSGTNLRVMAVKECKNCLFERRVHYQVQVTPEPEVFVGIPVLIRAESFTPREVSCGEDGGAA